MMLWRAPWLRARALLLSVAAWDVLCIFGSYRHIYIAKLNEWNGIGSGLVVIWATWLSTSYLIGRYSAEGSRAKLSRLTKLAATTVPAIAVLMVFVGHSWFYQVNDAATRLRGFVIPLLVICTVSSALGQLVALTLMQSSRKWSIVCSEQEKKLIAKEVKQLTERQRPRFLSKGELLLLNTMTANNESNIAVSESMMTDEETLENLLRLKERGITTISTIRWFEEKLQRIPTDLVNAQWLIQAEGFVLRPGSLNWRLKRLGDIIGASVLLVATAPVVLLSALLIYAEDRGPVFYGQIRTGYCGEAIRIWKLRSMKVNAEQVGGAQWAQKKDPRITKIGGLLRATRIDELPQLVNVIIGELSLIGPRPERPEFEIELEKHIPHYRVRHWIRPGLSGWAQVCFPYGASIEDSKAKLSYDLFYIRNSGIFLDLLILVKTIRLIAWKAGSEPNS